MPEDSEQEKKGNGSGETEAENLRQSKRHHPPPEAHSQGTRNGKTKGGTGSPDGESE